MSCSAIIFQMVSIIHKNQQKRIDLDLRFAFICLKSSIKKNKKKHSRNARPFSKGEKNKKKLYRKNKNTIKQLKKHRKPWPWPKKTPYSKRPSSPLLEFRDGLDMPSVCHSAILCEPQKLRSGGCSSVFGENVRTKTLIFHPFS